MLPRGEKRTVHLVTVCIDQFPAIRKGNQLPQCFEHLAASIANDCCYNLPSLSGTGHPEPKTAFLGDAQLINLERIPVGSVQKRLLPLLDYLLGPFLRTVAMVVRLTLSKRAIPRWERRSDKARCIWASFSGVTERSIGDGVKVLLQALQRQRAVPERLRPKRTTHSVS